MLATLQPTAVLDTHDLAQYRPAKDLEAFNALLPPPIEFVEGSSSGTLAMAEGKYKPINGGVSGTPKSGKTEAPESRRNSHAEKDKPLSSSGARQLYDHPIELSWPSGVLKGCGLVNSGNTCFLNSALQCLLHTPPLVNVLSRHGKEDKCSTKGAFCMSCSMRELMVSCYKTNRPIVPYAITSKLQNIAKHLRRGRQEDSHEFLRYAVDAMQKSCLAGYPPKIDHKLAETTWVHKIFGGRLRSRVSCLSCGYNSDTFDSILDLSIDIYNVQTLRDALRKFVAVDHLKGADKYKCEKCKKPVTADKQFTIHDAPLALTVHLKRFTPMGRKMAHPIRYDDRISLQPYMSQGQHGPMYSLYGVICHAGGGPNSGHYYAFVKDANGKWFEMNDESVTQAFQPPLGLKNAYILFYLRDKGQALDAAINLGSSGPKLPKAGLVAGMKRRKVVESDDEDEDSSRPPAPSTKGRFIGPLLPSPLPKPSEVTEPRPDPQAEKLKRKIAERQAAGATSPIKPSAALQSLAQYDDSSSSNEDLGEKVEDKDAPETASTDKKVDKALPPTPSGPSSPVATKRPSSPISTKSFYASATPKRLGEENSRKRKSFADDDDDDENEGGGKDDRAEKKEKDKGKEKGKEKDVDELGQYVRTPLAHASSSPPRRRKGALVLNPYNRMSGGGRNRNGGSSQWGPQYGKRVGRMKPRII